ncbi:MAG: sialidase family protein [Acidobacteriota bacterium]
MLRGFRSPGRLSALRISRRSFLHGAAAGLASHGLVPAGWSRVNRSVKDIEHVHVHGNRLTYCGHPRQCGLFYFGNGELVVMHNHAPCAYEKRSDVQHDFGGYHSRSMVLLQRSMDGGRTWPGENDVEVWNEAASLENRREFLLSGLTSPRSRIDLAQPNSIVFFPRTFLGPWRYGAPQMVAFALRSSDKGKTWEQTPTLIVPPPGCYSASPDNAPIVRLPDGTWLFPNRTFGGRNGVSLYASTDNGLSWEFRTHICEPHGYPALLLLKSGRLQCYNYPLGMCYSDDGGRTWSERKLILPASPSPWAQDDPVYHEELAHRSPTPILLKDGRIVVLFARRISPGMGMGGMVSEDGGATWGPDFILRNDAATYQPTTIRGKRHDYSDIGYPLAAELEDGRIFTAYYYMLNDGNGFGGSRFIAGTFFRVA